MNLTNQLGQLTELWCQLDFCERGIVLSQPTNPSSRYDFIAEINNNLYRIQCKTASEQLNNRILINIISKNWNSKEVHSYVGEVDYFYTHWNGKSYLLPIELCAKTNRTKTIRLGEPKDYSQNKENAIYGKDYELDKILHNLGCTNRRITIEDSEIRKTATILRNKTNTCIDCGKPICSTSTRCQECYKKSKLPQNMPSREELKELIRVLPFTSIGEKYGKSDNSVRKWCDRYSLPRKKTDINAISDEDWITV